MPPGQEMSYIDLVVLQRYSTVVSNSLYVSDNVVHSYSFRSAKSSFSSPRWYTTTLL